MDPKKKLEKKLYIFNPQVMEVDGSDNLPDFDLGDVLGEPAVHFFLGGGRVCSSQKKTGDFSLWSNCTR